VNYVQSAMVIEARKARDEEAAFREQEREIIMQNHCDAKWAPYLQRYAEGEWRATIFRDMILCDARKLSQERDDLSFLDIGCGGGFDADPKLQRSIARAAGKYIGIEPDKDIELSPIFHSVHRCRLEDAHLDPDSVDIAFAVMVLEHSDKPDLFWRKVHKVLRRGGVFWGFTVDARHWFVTASLLTERLHIKDLYLNMLLGKRGEERYENYGVFYRSNTPKQIQKMTKAFSSITILNFHRVGQIDDYIPKKLRWLSRAVDRYAIRTGRPGSLMAVRAEK
jgi:SAM-dependent methyltransferase